MTAHSFKAGVDDITCQDRRVVEEILSDGHRIATRFARPGGATRLPAVVLMPGFPRGTGGAALAGNTYPQLADRIAAESGWAALTLHYRGTGPSSGSFSIEGWLADVAAVIGWLRERKDVSGVWLAGFRLGGSLAIITAARDLEVRGIATFAAPASLQSWVPDAPRFADYCRRVGVLPAEGELDDPDDVERWGSAIAELDIESAAAAINPRPWLLVHGSDDRVVNIEHARRLAAASKGAAELRILEHAAHRLRHDPRAIAMLLGWLDRQR
jgi:putative redox protein